MVSYIGFTLILAGMAESLNDDCQTPTCRRGFMVSADVLEVFEAALNKKNQERFCSPVPYMPLLNAAFLIDSEKNHFYE